MVKEEPINIKDLVLDEPVRKEAWVFDPKTDLTDEEWREIAQVFKGSDSDRFQYFELASYLKFLNPALLEEIYSHPNSREQLWQLLNVAQPQIGTNIHLNLLQQAKLLFPQQFKTVEVSDEAMGRWLEKLADEKSKAATGVENWAEYLFNAVPFYVVFPNKRPLIGADDNVWQGIKKETDSDSTISALTKSALLRVLYPDRSPNFHFNKEILDVLRRHRGGVGDIDEDELVSAWSEFVIDCTFLLILQADRIQVNDKGLELISKNDSNFKGEPVPEVRQF